MTITDDVVDLTRFDDQDGAARLPRSNGELVFDAPWQGRLFGLVVHLCKAGAFEWDEFKAHLIAVIDESGLEDVCDPAVYYRQFGEAFCRLADEKGFFEASVLERRTLIEGERLAHADHDHDHDHDHHH
ncbi:nitrile hydratase accessory protein [Mycolicibacterium smegmatis]|uniref:nitrile hydratase accessory protein n=1 Tax=Mycolicibacterium smegmatis TaxID=1772 RepID=UPI001303363D|nr:nitrile hydratase accessory protein [Mycolicibacterium smegmatis]